MFKFKGKVEKKLPQAKVGGREERAGAKVLRQERKREQRILENIKKFYMVRAENQGRERMESWVETRL